MKVPSTMEHLPRTARGLPVPHVAAWSSERWGVARWDPLVQWHAVFPAGRHGRGRPVLGALHEHRQRRAMVLGRCGVCDIELGPGDRWLPTVATEQLDSGVVLATEPPCCRVCVTFALDVCPGLRESTGLLRIDRMELIAQLVDPSRAPQAHAARFGGDDPAARERLGRIARRHGGLVGYVKAALVEVTVP